MEVIVHRHEMNRAPTLEDRQNKLGLEEFIKKLEKAGWVVGEDATLLKHFTYSSEGNAEAGNNYIEYKAVLVSHPIVHPSFTSITEIKNYN